MMQKILLLATLTTLLAGAPVAWPKDLVLPRDEAFGTCDHFSDNLWGLHSRLEENYGLSFEIIYRQDIFWNTRGGNSTKSPPDHPRMAGLYLELDTAAAGLWQNGTFFAGLEYMSGTHPSESRVGDWQYMSWISTDHTRAQISEFWYRHSFLEDAFWVKLGKMEANTDFNAIDYSLDFINSSAALNPTIPIPSYPDQDWGLVAGIEPSEHFAVNAGIYQGTLNGSRSIGNTLDDLRGPMLIIEPSFKYEINGLPGKINAGAWWNGRKFDAYHEYRTNRTTYGRSYGFYGFIQQLLWKENPDDAECTQGVGVYGQYGWVPKDRSEIDSFIGGGLTWQGAVRGRDEDVAGLGAFCVYFSDSAGFDDRAETAVELFYKAWLTGWLVLQPDVQFISNPGGVGNRNALAVGGRVEFVF